MTSRTDLIMRARDYIQRAGQVPNTSSLSANPNQTAWDLLEQVLSIAESEKGDHDAVD